MHFRIISVRRGKATHRYAQIVERYTENGKARNKVIRHLGPVKNGSDEERYRRMFALENQRDHVARADIRDLDLLSPREYGIIYASRILCHDLGMDQVFYALDQYYDIIFLAVISRLIYPSSDYDLLRLSEKIEYPVQDLKKDRIYAALDRLIEKKDDIELGMFHALHPDTTVVHYDLISSYFEGKEDNDLVLFDYSRDKKRGKEQIVIGLVMANGIPIHHQVFPGNTVDPKTLESTISVLKDRFHVKNVIFIADRIFGRTRSLDILDHNQYITAAYRWDQPYRNVLMNTDFSGGSTVNDLVIKSVSINLDDVIDEDSTEDQRKLAEKRRYIAVYNRNREELDLKDLNNKLVTVKKKMLENRDQKELKKSLGKLKSLVKFSANGSTLNVKRIHVLKKLAGRFLIVTNTALTESEVVSAYKEQWQIERSFRTVKSFLEIRPIYHRKSDRIKAHVFLCVLSLLIARLFEKATEDKMTMSVISDMLSELKAVAIRIPEGEITLRTESENARNILGILKIPYPGKIVNDTLTVQ